MIEFTYQSLSRHRKTLQYIALMCAAVVLSFQPLPDIAHAQGPAAKRKAQRVARQATKAYEAQEYEKAIKLFKQAHKAAPDPEYLYFVASAYKETDQYVESQKYYQRYLEANPGSEKRDQILETIFELQQLMAMQTASVNIKAANGLEVYVDDEDAPQCITPCTLALTPGNHLVIVQGETREVNAAASSVIELNFGGESNASLTGQLMFSSNAEGGQLFLDGQPQAMLPMAKPIDLEAGIYPASVMVDGASVWMGSIEIRAGEMTERNITVGAQSTPITSSSTSTMTIAAYTLWGAGVVSLGAGTFFGLAAADAEEKLDNQLSNQMTPDQDLVDTGENQALLANLFLGIGVATIGTGIVLYLLDDGDTEASQASTSSTDKAAVWWATPTKDGGVVGVGVPF